VIPQKEDACKRPLLAGSSPLPGGLNTYSRRPHGPMVAGRMRADHRIRQKTAVDTAAFGVDEAIPLLRQPTSAAARL
jgi:hypothetical protein